MVARTMVEPSRTPSLAAASATAGITPTGDRGPSVGAATVHPRLLDHGDDWRALLTGAPPTGTAS